MATATGLVSSLGVGSGLPLQSMLDQLRAADEQAVTAQKKLITQDQDQISEFNVVNNKLLTMKSSALNLSLSTSFNSRTATSSNPSAFTVTVAGGTAPQTTNVTVDRIATQSTWISTGMATSTSSVNTTGSSQNFVYHVGTKDITVAVAANTTLSGLVDLINKDTNNPGVTASVINDGSVGTPYKLVLQSKSTGSNTEITSITPPPDLTMNTPKVTGADLNAQVTVGGVSYQRQTNTTGDVLSGITLNLQASGASTVTVTSNDNDVAKMVTDFVTAYNDVVQEVDKNTAYDSSTNTFGNLAGTTLRDLPYELQDLMTSSVQADSKGLVTSMFALGLEFNRDGTISINSDTLNAAITASPDSVSAFFLGDATKNIKGMGDKVNGYLLTLTSDAGQVAAEKTAAQTRIDGLNASITADEDRLNKKYDMLTKQFIALDQYVSQMKSMGTYLTSQFNSLSGLTSGSSSTSGN